ncbi:MAG: IclR family transcriptional regulator [Nostocoides sp.]
MDVRPVAAAVMTRLSARFGETCHVAVREQDHALYVDKVTGTHNLRVQGAPIGARLDLHCTAVGKILISYNEPAAIEEYLSQNELSRHTPRTITGADAFRAETGRVRQQGFAVDLGETVDDVYCVAAPIRDELGAVVAALSMSAPVNRFERHRSEYIRWVQDAATSVSRGLIDHSLSDDEQEAQGIDYPGARA